MEEEFSGARTLSIGKDFVKEHTWLLLLDVKALAMSMPLDLFFSTAFASRGFWKNFKHPSLYSSYNPSGEVMTI